MFVQHIDRQCSWPLGGRQNRKAGGAVSSKSGSAYVLEALG